MLSPQRMTLASDAPAPYLSTAKVGCTSLGRGCVLGLRTSLGPGLLAMRGLTVGEMWIPLPERHRSMRSIEDELLHARDKIHDRNVAYRPAVAFP